MRTRAPHRSRGSSTRGVTLLEVMISMAIFAIGLAGLARLQVIAAGADGHATRVDQATTLALGLASYLGHTIPYTSTLLTDAMPGVDGDLTDDANTCALTGATGFQADHSDAEITGTMLCSGTPSATCFPGPDPGSKPYGIAYQRYWRVWDLPQGPTDPAQPGKAIVVFVRWLDPGTGTYRCVHQLTFRPNPQVMAP